MRHKLTVRDLIYYDIKNDIDELSRGRVIAFDAGTGKQLFDTYNNTLSRIESYYEGVICAIWAGTKESNETYPLSGNVIPALCIYVEHNSWF